ncbi:MAG: nucleoside phosphorylase [Desulfurococcales archaeon]|nr:nucleoside phosphorylase [Desulfurococcales archaeon]
MRKPVHLEATRVPSNMLIVGDPDRAAYLAEELLSNPKLINKKRGYYIYEGFFGDRPVGIGVHYVGGPTTAVFVEELAMIGARRIVRLGTAGSLCENVKLGDIVVPPSSGHATIGGLLKQYAPQGIPPLSHTPSLVLRLYEAIKSKGLNPMVSPVVSSDAFYAEDEGFASYWCSRNVVAVEMECSTLAYIGLARNLETACALIISDELLHLEKGHLDSLALKEEFVKAASAVLEVMTGLEE